MLGAKGTKKTYIKGTQTSSELRDQLDPGKSQHPILLCPSWSLSALDLTKWWSIVISPAHIQCMPMMGQKRWHKNN